MPHRKLQRTILKAGYQLLRSRAAVSLVLFAVPCLGQPGHGQQDIQLDRHGDKVSVRLDGALFTEYLAHAQPNPILWPILGPTGKHMTRAYPMKRNVTSELQDHPHHRSFWFGHGNVNGIDFWSNRAGSGSIRHETFLRLQSEPVPLIETKNVWLNESQEHICSDVRQLTFGADAERRWIDFDITIHNDSGVPLTFGDTKEGTLGLRVAESIKVDAGLGGQIINSLGDVNRSAWGKRASWVDYHGPVDNQLVGIAVLNHPNSFRFPTYWHVRTYGLLAANVFGLHNFKNSHEENGSHTLQPGESMSFFYRVILHRGDEQQGRIPEAFAEYVKSDKPIEGLPLPVADQVPLVPEEPKPQLD